MKAINRIISNHDARSRLEARYWPKVARLSESDCWEWIAKAKHPFGYGRMTAGRGVQIKAHHIGFALANGPIPDGAWVLHRCDRPSCCNPAHLFLGTPKDNTRDMMAKGRESSPPRRYGEAHPNTKFGEAAAVSIAADQRPAREIAAEFEICEMTVYRLKRGKTWRRLSR